MRRRRGRSVALTARCCSRGAWPPDKDGIRCTEGGALTVLKGPSSSRHAGGEYPRQPSPPPPAHPLGHGGSAAWGRHDATPPVVCPLPAPRSLGLRGENATRYRTRRENALSAAAAQQQGWLVRAQGSPGFTCGTRRHSLWTVSPPPTHICRRRRIPRPQCVTRRERCVTY